MPDQTLSKTQRRHTVLQLLDPIRTAPGDHALAVVLAAVAGAANAGGFFALGEYTSHMTGYLARLADNLAIANLWISFVSVLAIAAFVTGAAFSAIVINWARDRRSQHQYALPIAIQGGLLICFSWGWIFTAEAGRLFALCCLCFIMGMQNATITKLSGARIRTTHATGMVTDIGIELGRATYGLLQPGSGVAANGGKLRILLAQVFAFLGGGIVGAFGYAAMGFQFSLPLAAILLGISLPSLLLKPAAEHKG
jgi:uncharacterized membrane protein YoaK (UPF0700 family)